MSELFQIKDSNRNVRYKDRLVSCNIKTTLYGIDSISHLAPKIWEQVPNDIKLCGNLNLFKNKIKSWVPDKCPCRICKTYISGVGFIN